MKEIDISYQAKQLNFVQPGWSIRNLYLFYEADQMILGQLGTFQASS